MEQKIFIDPTRKFNNKTKPVNDRVSIKDWWVKQQICLEEEKRNKTDWELY